MTPLPVVTGIFPASGTTAGGTEIVLMGTGFTGATSVHFGTASGTIDANTGTFIIVTTPTHAAGIVDVTVTTPSGTSAIVPADKFTYVSTTAAVTLASGATTNNAQTVITGILVASGTTAGGTQTVITGTGFTGATSGTLW